jgi:hypothetical protein
MGGATGGSGNLSTSLSSVARLRHIQNLCGFSTPTRHDGTIIMTLQIVLIILVYNDACRSEQFINMMVGDIEHKSNMILVSIPKIKTN